MNELSLLRIEVSETINADPADVYAILADYRVSRHAILPKPYFSKLILDQGGHGAGTIVEAYLEAFGMKRCFRQLVSEPEPGRTLVETDDRTGSTTTFTVDPFNDGHQSRVTVTIIARTYPGLTGLLERFFLPIVFRRAYGDSLELLAEYARHGL
jgi:hypothetical protein